MKFEDKDVAIVSGGTSGLGKATAELLVKLGLTVIVFGTDKVKGEYSSQKIGTEFQQVDVTDYISVNQGFARSLEGGRKLRIMINCAGIAPVEKTISKGQAHTPELFEKTLKVNVLGTLYCASQAAALIATNKPIDLDGQKGIIINTASTAAYDGQMGQVAYAASKGAIVSMTLPMARDLASHGIRVCTIAPGLFETPLVDSIDESVKKTIKAQTPFPPRLGKSYEFAKLIKHIILNPMFNGEVIRIDGGLRMAFNKKS